MMVVVDQATAMVAATRVFMLDAEVYRSALGEGNLIVADESDVEGDICDVLLVSRRSVGHIDHVATYVSVSRQQSVPRALRSVRRVRGRTILDRQYVITEFQPNPEIDDGLFEIGSGVVVHERVGEPDRGRQDEKTPSREGVAWPAIDLLTASDEHWVLADEVDGPVIVSFWAPWCVWCIKEFPELVAIERDYGGALSVVAIAVLDSRLRVKEFIGGNGQFDLEFVIDPDLGRERSRLVDAFGIRALPMTLLIDRDRIVRDSWSGYLDGPELRARVARAFPPPSK